MPVTFTGSEAEKQAKLDRIRADLEAANGVAYGIDPETGKSVITLANIEAELHRKLDALKLPHGNEQETLNSLRKAALDQILGADDSRKAQETRVILTIMGYANSHPSMNGTAWGVSRAESGIDTFLQKHPEFRNESAGMLLEKIKDTMWTEATKQPPGTYINTRYLTTDVAAELKASAEASFGGKDGVRAIQAQLYMRDPSTARQPDGEWTIEDQRNLINFVNQVNQHRDADHKIPSLIEMRWPGRIDGNNPPIADRQKDMGDRIRTALTNHQIGWAEANYQNIMKDKTQILSIPTRADSSSNPDDIRKMQAYMKVLGAYESGNEMPTGIWTARDQKAMQKLFDNNNPWYWFNSFQDSASGMTGAQFQEALKTAAKLAKDKGLTDAMVTPDANGNILLSPQKKVDEPPPRGQQTAPVTEVTEERKPVIVTPPAEENSDPGRTGGKTGADHIEDADAARVLAQLHVMGAYEGKFTGAEADLNGALKEYAKNHKALNISGESDLTPDQTTTILSAIQKDWETWVKDPKNAQTIKDKIDKGYEEKSKKHNPDVREMQIALLAMGGSLPNFGTDGSYGHETATTLKALMAVGGNYRAILDAAGIPHTEWKGETPGQTQPDNQTPAPKVNTSSGGFGDLLGEGGFIVPLPPPPAPVVARENNPAAVQSREAVIVSGPKETKVEPPKVTTATIRDGDSSGMTPYFNAQAGLSPKDQAEMHFRNLSPAFILDDRGAKSLNYRVEKLLQARDGRDQGQVFVVGPDGRYAERYAYNAGILTPLKLYDMNNDRDRERFDKDLRQAAQKEAAFNPGQPGRVPITPTTLAGVPNDTRGHVMANAQPIVGGAMMAFLTLRNLGIGH
jgi:hypothetical protein